MATTSVTDRNTIKGWFKRGLKPLETQFAQWIDSFWHKNDSIPITSIENLQQALNDKTTEAYVDQKIADINPTVNDATTTAKGVVMLSSTLGADETKAATPSLVKVVQENLANIIAVLAGNIYTKTETNNAITAAISGLIWKDGVSLFSEIATKYPAPEIGWLVPCDEEGIIYRWNGTDWVNSYLGLLTAALLKYAQSAEGDPTFNGNRLAYLSDLSTFSDASETAKGIVMLANDILEASETKAATQKAVKDAHDSLSQSVSSALANLQDSIENISLTPGPAAPHVVFQYSVSGYEWHANYVAGDAYFRTSTDGGTSWGDAVLYKGDSGNSAFQDWLNISGNAGKSFEDYLAYMQGGKFTVSMNFETVIGYSFVCPSAMKIDTVETNTSGATLAITKGGVNYVLGTSLAKFDVLIITPSAVAFFNLNCSTL